MDELFKHIVLGALLHDVGKVCQRADKRPTRHKHQRFGVEWFESLRPEVKRAISEDVKDYILWHHSEKDDELDVRKQARGDLLLVWEADNLAAGERPEKAESEFDHYCPLYSVFQRVFPKYEGQWYGYKPVALHNATVADLFPSPSAKASQKDYQELLSKFTEELSNKATNSYDILTLVLNLLEQYFSLVPSETAIDRKDYFTYPDISLFDHLKMTAAISACLYQYFLEEKRKKPGEISEHELTKRDEERFLLVSGDMSGIQDFIYNITYRAALKGLRARSFYISFLCEHFVRKLLQEMNMPRTNVIYCAGGGFVLLLPNTKKAEETIEKLRYNFNRWLLKEFWGRLFLAVYYVPLSGIDISGKGKLIDKWHKLREGLNRQKRQKFSEFITREFFSPQPTKLENCQICNKPLASYEVKQIDLSPEETYRVCGACDSFIRIGSKLLSSKYIVQATTQNGDFVIEDTWYRLSIEKPKGLSALYAVNTYDSDAIMFWVGRFVPKEGIEFNELVDNGVGAYYLGTLRADVDNLGMIFSDGLDERLRTFSRIATLSRFLALFFSRLVNEIAKGNLPERHRFDLFGRSGKRQIVVVYSGGDDLFVTGAWHDVVEFAFELRRAFSSFVAGNPKLTFSAGIVLSHVKKPIYRIAYEAAKAEDRAKGNEREEGNGQKRVKDSLYAFGCVMFWDEWEEAIRKVLLPLCNIGERTSKRFIPAFPSGLIHKLLALEAETTHIAKHKGDRESLLVVPKIPLVLSRASPRKEYSTQWEEFVKNAIHKDPWKILDWLKASYGPLCWIDYLIRGGEG